MWITRKKLEQVREEAFQTGFRMGELNAMRKILYQKKGIGGELTTLVEKQIAAILQKAEEQKRNNG